MILFVCLSCEKEKKVNFLCVEMKPCLNASSCWKFLAKNDVKVRRRKLDLHWRIMSRSSTLQLEEHLKRGQVFLRKKTNSLRVGKFRNSVSASKVIKPSFLTSEKETKTELIDFFDNNKKHQSISPLLREEQNSSKNYHLRCKSRNYFS